MKFNDTDLENFLSEEIPRPTFARIVTDAVIKGPGGEDALFFNLWHLDIHHEQQTVNLWHDFDDRETTYSTAEFMAALDAHVATLESR